MITLTASGNSIVFAFSDSKYYLYGTGTITVPKNSLALITDDSDFAVFKKADSNDIFVTAPYADFGKTKEELISFYEDNMVGGGGSVDPEDVIDIVESGTTYVDGAVYVSSASTIYFYHGENVVTSIDASDFVIDGMVDNVSIQTISGASYLVIDFNTASGKADINIPLTDIFNPDNYYDKTAIDGIVSGINETLDNKSNKSATVGSYQFGEVNNNKYIKYRSLSSTDIGNPIYYPSINGKDILTNSSSYASNNYDFQLVETSAVTSSVTSASTDSEIPTAKAVYDAIGQGGGGGNNTVELTQAQYDALVSGGTVDPSTYYIITDAQSVDISQYWTSAQTDSAITSAVSGKVDTSAITTAVTSGSTDSEIPTAKAVYDAIGQGGGGGKAIEAGRGITITTGATADTVSVNLPLYSGTGNNSIYQESKNQPNYPNNASGENSFIVGTNNTASGSHSIAMGGFDYNGDGCSATSYNSFAIGRGTLSDGLCSIAKGYKSKATNQYEESGGRFNVSNKANTTWGDSGNTLFSVGNGTEDNARHNAFEIRQNGDIYISSGGTDILLQDHLGGGGGGSITIDPSLDSGSTNAVANSAITNAINAVSGAIPSTYVNSIEADTDQGYQRMYRFSTPSNYNYFLLRNAKINGRQVLNSGWSLDANEYSLVETSAVTSSVTSGSTDVITSGGVYDQFGGLKLVKISQTDYDNLQVKDSNTLYVITDN